jgi:hypothetical protein
MSDVWGDFHCYGAATPPTADCGTDLNTTVLAIRFNMPMLAFWPIASQQGYMKSDIPKQVYGTRMRWTISIKLRRLERHEKLYLNFVRSW